MGIAIFLCQILKEEANLVVFVEERHYGVVSNSHDGPIFRV